MRRLRWILFPTLIFCLFSIPVLADTNLAPVAMVPRDWHHRIEASEFEKSAAGEWTSPLVRPDFAFNELIYSWHLHHPGDTFRLYLKAVFGPKDETDWLYAGFWGKVKDPVAHRVAPTFDRGILDMDFLKLKVKATGFRFKVVSAGTEPLAAPPALTVIATDHPQTVETTVHAASDSTDTNWPVLDIPLRRQFDSQGVRIVDRCQSAALASAMEYYGKSVPLENIVKYTYDPEYAYPGIWPRVLAAAQEFGYDSYIERFRDWDAVRRALAANKILLCSMRFKEGECQSPPYPSQGNHIVALCGVTADHRVVVTDSFLGKDGTGHLCQWLQSDFEKIWMQTKGGVAMVICPPSGAVPRPVAQLPPFPANRPFPTGDDH